MQKMHYKQLKIEVVFIQEDIVTASEGIDLGGGDIGGQDGLWG